MDNFNSECFQVRQLVIIKMIKIGINKTIDGLVVIRSKIGIRIKNRIQSKFRIIEKIGMSNISNKNMKGGNYESNSSTNNLWNNCCNSSQNNRASFILQSGISQFFYFISRSRHLTQRRSIVQVLIT